MRRTFIVGVAFWITTSLYPCNIVKLAGEEALSVRRVTGTVIGSGSIDLMGKMHDTERKSAPVTGAVVLLRLRTNTISDQETHSKLLSWNCGKEIVRVTTNTRGEFAMPSEAGEYCLDITGPAPNSERKVRMHSRFVINVSREALDQPILADITPLWPDCSGGGSLKLASATP